MDTNRYSWTVRAHRGAERVTKIYARNHLFSVGSQASFDIKDAHLSAVEYLLGALAADLTAGFQAQTARRRIPVTGIEMQLSGSLNNALTHLGVIGEEGRPGFESMSGTLYVSADAALTDLEELWQTALERSPLFNTLKHCVKISISLQAVL